MLTREDDVDAHALRRQGWTITAIALSIRKRSFPTSTPVSVSARSERVGHRDGRHPGRARRARCRPRLEKRGQRQNIRSRAHRVPLRDPLRTRSRLPVFGSASVRWSFVLRDLRLRA